MACETFRSTPQQTPQERADEIRRAVSGLDQALRMKMIKPVVGKQGGITFAGWTSTNRAGVTDACAYRRIMATGSALARAEIARAEQLAGRTVDRNVVNSGLHSHDGGKTWDKH